MEHPHLCINLALAYLPRRPSLRPLPPATPSLYLILAVLQLSWVLPTPIYARLLFGISCSSAESNPISLKVLLARRPLTGAAKFHYCASPKTNNINEMEENVRACLDDVPHLQIQWFVIIYYVYWFLLFLLFLFLLEYTSWFRFWYDYVIRFLSHHFS